MVKHLLAIPTLLIAAHAAAECPNAPPSQVPAIPDGSSAARSEMYEAQVAVSAYVNAIEHYLSCNSEKLIGLQHNHGIALAETTAERYNAELQTFRTRTGQLATN